MILVRCLLFVVAALSSWTPARGWVYQCPFRYEFDGNYCLLTDPGCPVGQIWDASQGKCRLPVNPRKPVSPRQSESCTLGIVPMSSYIMSVNNVSVNQVGQEGTLGTLYDLIFSQTDLPASVPLVINDMDERHLYEEVVWDAERFLSSWSDASSSASIKDGTFGMPWMTEVDVCIDRYQELAQELAEKRGSQATFPANALIVFHTPIHRGLIADILEVYATEEDYVMRIRVAKDEHRIAAPEFECLDEKSLENPVYQHPTRCLQVETESVLSESNMDGHGFTAFVKVESVLESPGMQGKQGGFPGRKMQRLRCPPAPKDRIEPLSIHSGSLRPLPGYAEDLPGDFVAITVPKSRLPASIPFVKNDLNEGRMYQDILNATDFFVTWTNLAKQASLETAPLQCQAWMKHTNAFRDVSGKGLESTPSNALFVFGSSQNEAFVADIFDVLDVGDSFEWHVRLAPGNSRMNVKEGECHDFQSFEQSHYHHASKCLVMQSNNTVVELDGVPMTAFIRLTPFVGALAVGVVEAVEAGAVVAEAVEAGAAAVEVAEAGAAAAELLRLAAIEEVEVSGVSPTRLARLKGALTKCFKGWVAAGLVESIGDGEKQGIATAITDREDADVMVKIYYKLEGSPLGSFVKGALKGILSPFFDCLELTRYISCCKRLLLIILLF
ncbi:hypothetical protein PSENEW3n2_00005105 [Picochlorum sp. SENEW3]|nr:hypothetical protein PSENEW3n2_00005105 [Picochlorum sp. SENEW3]WPT17098.1 hypothetical protein PSENEW3_00005105 [Picochlorum sp. SENEW3]